MSETYRYNVRCDCGALYSAREHRTCPNCGRHK